MKGRVTVSLLSAIRYPELQVVVMRECKFTYSANSSVAVHLQPQSVPNDDVVTGRPLAEQEQLWAAHATNRTLSPDGSVT